MQYTFTLSLLVVLSIIAGLLVVPVDSFAQYMMKEFCNRNLEDGEIIMNAAVITSDERHVRVFLDEEELFSGDFYRPGDQLSIMISDESGEFLFETNTYGEFSAAENEKSAVGCQGRRALGRKGSSARMVVAPDGFEEVSRNMAISLSIIYI